MGKRQESVEGYVHTECWLIANDPRETPARRRLAQTWLDRFEASVNGWGNDGQTMAEAAGITPEKGAPGGQKMETGVPGYAGVSRSSGQVPDIEAGELSTELHSGQRTRRQTRERPTW